MTKVCDKHKKHPAIIYHGCIGCEIDALRSAQPSNASAMRVSSDNTQEVEWTWKDTLEFVRKDFLSSEIYVKLREGGSVAFNKRQLTNLLNGAFDYIKTQPAITTQAAKQDSADNPDDPKNAAILAWWRGKRPFGWSEEEHIEEPAAYCTGAEKPLALLAVEIAKAQLLRATED